MLTRNVLITGGCGFIGRYVADEMRRAGYQVRILDSLVEQVHGGGTSLSRNDDVVIGDVRDPDAVRTALDGIENVIHLAAEVGVGQSMYEVARYVGANDLGTAVLLEDITKKPVRSIVVASSMSVYGEGSIERSMASAGVRFAGGATTCARGSGTRRTKQAGRWSRSPPTSRRRWTLPRFTP